MPWDAEAEKKYREHPNLLLNDETESGKKRLEITKRAFEKYYVKGHDLLWEDLNPQVREHWLQHAKALLSAVGEVLNSANSGATAVVIIHQRKSILELEVRAALRHGRKLTNTRFDIENEPTCPLCGHIQPETHKHDTVAASDAVTPAPPVELPGPTGEGNSGHATGELRRDIKESQS
jgi:hypothetical protein